MNQEIKRGDEIVLDGQVHLVFVDKKGKPVKLPDEIYSKFKPYFAYYFMPFYSKPYEI